MTLFPQVIPQPFCTRESSAAEQHFICLINPIVFSVEKSVLAIIARKAGLGSCVLFYMALLTYQRTKETVVMTN